MSYLTEEQIESFKENGFLVVDNFFSEEEISDFTEVARDVIRAQMERASRKSPEIFTDLAPGEEFDRGLILLTEFDREYLDSIYDTLWKTPEFLRLVSKRETEVLVNQLMGRKPNAPLYGFINRCRIALPKDARFDWHQEIFQTVPEAEFLQTWASLIHDASREAGAMQLCVGSHKAPKAKPAWRENANGVAKIFFDDEFADQFEQATMDLKLGQVVFFTGHIVHRSGENTSEKVRYSLVGLYHNVEDVHFDPPKLRFVYRKRTPKEYFDSLPPIY